MPKPGEYGAAVARILAEDLPDFPRDIAGLVFDQVRQFHRRPWDHFEVLVGPGDGARWRLKPQSSGSNLVRLADYAMSPSPERSAVCDAINRRLSVIE